MYLSMINCKWPRKTCRPILNTNGLYISKKPSLTQVTFMRKEVKNGKPQKGDFVKVIRFTRKSFYKLIKKINVIEIQL